MTPVHVILDKLIPIFEQLEIPYMVGGSFASSAWGFPRQTLDIDIAVFLSAVGARNLLEHIKGEFMVSESDMAEAVHSSDIFRAFQMIHFEETFKVDVFVLHQNEYSEESMARSVPYELFPGLFAQFASPEDTVITKLRWFLLGNKVSDRQWNDIVLVLEKCHGQLDEDYLVKWATHFQVDDLLRDAQGQNVMKNN